MCSAALALGEADPTETGTSRCQPTTLVAHLQERRPGPRPCLENANLWRAHLKGQASGAWILGGPEVPARVRGEFNRWQVSDL